VNLVIVRVLGGHHGHDHSHDHAEHDHGHSLNFQGSLAHIATDLFGFIATAIAAGVILATGFRRADAIASLLIAAVMVSTGWPLLRKALRVMMEAAPAGVDPSEIGNTLAAQPGVEEVHDLHVWEVTSGFPALSAHVVVAAGHDCHELRADMTRLLSEHFGIAHSTLQVEHAQAQQPPLQIEISRHA
ncbi:MAG: cation transporter, partial [Solirubrobacterales bacterium]|nr:cation transporter [Solirubrobacterales bacterium]